MVIADEHLLPEHLFQLIKDLRTMDGDRLRLDLTDHDEYVIAIKDT